MIDLIRKWNTTTNHSVIRLFGYSVIGHRHSVIRLFGYSVIGHRHSVISRGGFTIIELLVASLLLGMLMTILTMIFNQSSIAWRTGMAGQLDMDVVRENVAEVREEADNAFVWGNVLYRHTGLWKADGTLRNRACDAPDQTDQNDNHAEILRSARDLQNDLANLKPNRFKPLDVKSASGKSKKTYTVNVMSAGPDRQFDTWDDIWSFPDDFE